MVKCGDYVSVVDYKVRDDLRNLTVCLYDASADVWRYTTDNFQNYILDCAYQVEHGLPVKRIPFHITPSKADAQRAIDEMRSRISERYRAEKELAEKNAKQEKNTGKTSWASDMWKQLQGVK